MIPVVRLKKIFLPLRVQPPHVNHISLLKAASRMAERIVVGVGSINRQDERNPYSYEEREEMLKHSLDHAGIENYDIIGVPDFDSDAEWVGYCMKNAGFDKDTAVVSGNEDVLRPFEKEGYLTIRPEEIDPGQVKGISATVLRRMIAEENPEWRRYAASGTLHHFDRLGGKERIVKIKKNSF